MVHPVIVLQELHVIGAVRRVEVRQLALHQLLHETEKIKVVLDLDKLRHLVGGGDRLHQRVAAVRLAVTRAGDRDAVEGGGKVVVPRDHACVPMPLYPRSDQIRCENVALEGQRHAGHFDRAEDIVRADEPRELWVLPHLASAEGHQSLLPLDDEKVLLPVVLVQEFIQFEGDEIGGVVSLQAEVGGVFRFVAVPMPFQVLFTGKGKIVIVAVVHDKVELFAFQLCDVGLGELVDRVFAPGIIPQIHIRHLPFILSWSFRCAQSVYP